jgi:hypothetical protein
LGSLVGLRTNPRLLHISVLAAFGAGALIAALTVELVAPTVIALEEGAGAIYHGDPYSHFFALVTGAVLGGILFVILDQLVNAHGGFLRKTATSLAHFRGAKHARLKELVEKFSQFPLLQQVPAHHVDVLVSMVRPVTFHDGEVIGNQGEDPDSLLFVLEGTVSAARDGRPAGEMGPGNVVGIIPFLTQLPYPGTATVKGTLIGYTLTKEDFDRLRSLSPAFDQASRGR